MRPLVDTNWTDFHPISPSITPNPLRTVLIDDESCVRSAVKLLLEHELGFLIVGELSSVTSLDRLQGACDLAPDLVLLDWELPGLDPKPQLKRLRACYPAVKIAALSGRPDARAAALAAGADAFLYRGDPPDQLLGALSTLVLPESSYPWCHQDDHGNR